MWVLAWWAAAAGAADAVVEVRGLPNPDGVVICSLYASQATWLGKAETYATVRATSAGGSAACHFSWVPTEPWRTSRDAPITWGNPQWADAVFTVPGAQVVANAR